MNTKQVSEIIESLKSLYDEMKDELHYSLYPNRLKLILQDLQKTNQPKTKTVFLEIKNCTNCKHANSISQDGKNILICTNTRERRPIREWLKSNPRIPGVH